MTGDDNGKNKRKRTGDDNGKNERKRRRKGKKEAHGNDSTESIMPHKERNGDPKGYDGNGNQDLSQYN